ncbi:MAG TPA: TonB-dependent receptor, partial [Cryomorphaceae bacterium]|nr:TonB-dependent receptor [Cryomorphaceae bacterium]
ELNYSLFHTELGILRSAHIGNKTDFDLALARGEPFYQDPFSYAINSPRQDLTHQLLKSRLQYHPSAKGTLELVYSIQNNQRLEYDVRRGDAKNVAANNLNLSTQTLDLTARWNHSPKWNAEYGISGLLQINSNIPGTGIRPLLPNYNRYQGGAFMVQEYHTSRWIWEAGIRYDREYTLVQKFNFSNQLIRPEFSFNNLAASAGATYSFNRHWQLSNLLAYAYRPPHVNELMSEGLHHGAATIEVGDSSLVPERSLNWSTTLSANYPNAWKMELTAYLNPFQNYIYLNPQQEPRITIRGTFPVQQYTQDHVLLAGADLQGSIFLTTKLEYSLSGTYVRGINRSDDDDLVLMPPPQLNHSIHYYFRDFTLLKNSFISVSQKLVARQVHSPRDADLAPPPDAYSLLGLSMGTELPASDNRTFTFSLGVQNLLNTPYRDYLNRFRYYADQTGVNLQLKIKYEF